MGTEVNVNSGGGGNWKVIVALVVTLLAMAVGTYMISDKARKDDKANKEYIKQLSSSVTRLEDTARVYRVKLADGRKHAAAEIEELQMKYCTAKNLYADRMDEARRLGIRTGELQGAASVRIVTKKTVKEIPVYVDSLHRIISDYDDGYLRMCDTVFRNGTCNLSYCYRDSFNLYEYTRRKRFLFFRWGRKMTNFVVVAGNPDTKVIGVKVIRIVE